MAWLATLKMVAKGPDMWRVTADEFQSKPWKNGKGQTHDIFLRPKGANHSNFDLRFALSPIVEDGPFSSFPGADRVITLIEGEGLSLRFEDAEHRLERYQSLGFDTGLAPEGHPIGGPVKVINVMARRGAWGIKSCAVETAFQKSLKGGEFVFLFALSDDCLIRVDDTEETLPSFEALFLNSPCDVALISGRALCACLRSAQ